MKEVSFTVYGVPRSKARPRFVKMKNYVRTYTPKETINYETWVRTCWMEQSAETINDDAPISVRIMFYFPIPESFSAKKKERLENTPHCKMPDTDNCVKSILDGCQGYVFQNDSRIYRIVAEKRYSSNPRTEVIFEVSE